MAKILLIEDEPLWQHSFTTTLTRKNHQVVIADSYETAQAALTAAAAPDFALVLLDLVLDAWSGELRGRDLLPLLDALHTQHQTKVILLTDQDMYAHTVEAARNILFEHKDMVFGVFDKNHLGAGQEFLDLVQQAAVGSVFREDWWKPLDVTTFYGRESERAIIKKWIITERCRVVTILGMGGMGKSAMALKTAEEISDQFDYIFGRDLRNAPPFEEVISDAIKFLSDQQRIDLPENAEEKIAVLIEYLQKQCCLLVLDNLETLLQGGEQAGQYREGYASYGQLIQKVGSADHQSCLLITSREKPAELTLLEQTPYIQTLDLTGLQPKDGRDILRDKNVFGPEEQWQELSDRYAGNPLALKLVASTIGETFGGDIAEFLSQSTTVFGSIRDVLDQQFIRLSEREQDVMYWLAINREAGSLEELQEDIVDEIAKSELSEVIEFLKAHSMIEISGTVRFILQPVVLEFVTERLVKQICNEIKSEQIKLFISHALIKAQTKDYIRESQVRFILKPLVDTLSEILGKAELVSKLKIILSILHEKYSGKRGYGGGNLINSLVLIGIKPNNYNFSNLTIWQAYLQAVEFQNVNFAHADLAKSVFTKIFGSILSVAFSPDGKLLAAGDANCEIHLWNVANRQHLLTLKGHTNWIRSVTFSPDGQFLASGNDDQTVKIWNIQTGECLRTLNGHTKWIRIVTFSPNSQFIASGSEDNTIKIWDVYNGLCLDTLEGHEDSVWSISFSPDGRLLATASKDKTIKIWDMNNNQCLKTLRAHTDWVRAVAFSPDGHLLASASDDKTIMIWNVYENECIHIFEGHLDRIWSIVFSPKNLLLASSSDDRTIRIWDINNKKCLHTLLGHTNRIRTLAFNSDSRTIASGSEDQTIRLWDAWDGKCLEILQAYTNRLWSVAFSPDDHTIASGSEDFSVRIWDINREECVNTFQGHSNWVMSVDFSPDGQLVASGSQDKTVKIWDVCKGICLKTLKGHTDWIKSVKFSPDGKLLASGCTDKTIRLWNVKAGQCLYELKGHKNIITSVSFNSDSHILGSGSEDGTVRLWDIQSGSFLKSLQSEYNTRVWAIAFSPDGQTIASGNEDRTIKLWDIKKERCLNTFEGHNNWVKSVAFSPDGQTIASSSEDNTIRIWDIQTGRCLKILEGHTNSVWSVAFSSNGQVLVSCSNDQTIKIWNLQSGKSLKTLIPQRPYEGMNITGAKGLTQAQKSILKKLGAVEN